LKKNAIHQIDLYCEQMTTTLNKFKADLKTVVDSFKQLQREIRQIEDELCYSPDNNPFSLSNEFGVDIGHESSIILGEFEQMQEYIQLLKDQLVKEKLKPPRAKITYKKNPSKYKTFIHNGRRVAVSKPLYNNVRCESMAVYEVISKTDNDIVISYPGIGTLWRSDDNPCELTFYEYGKDQDQDQDENEDNDEDEEIVINIK